MLVQLYPASRDLEKPLPEARWTHSPAARLAQLLHQGDVRLGLATNGRHWMLVDAPRDEPTGFDTWGASLWSEEPLTKKLQ